MNLNDSTGATTFATYQTFVNNIRLQSADEAYAMLGLIGEIGELYGHLAKSVRDGYDPDMEHVKKGSGDSR
jgi:hypothetical protein